MKSNSGICGTVSSLSSAAERDCEAGAPGSQHLTAVLPHLVAEQGTSTAF